MFILYGDLNFLVPAMLVCEQAPNVYLKKLKRGQERIAPIYKTETSAFSAFSALSAVNNNLFGYNAEFF
jgi:hypothetical protein